MPLVSRISGHNPVAALKDVFDAQPNRASDFVEYNPTSKQLQPRAELTMNSDHTLAPTAANIEAMGQQLLRQDTFGVRISRTVH